MTHPELWLIIDTTSKVLLGGGIAFIGFWLARRWREQSVHEQGGGKRRKISLLEEISSDVGHVNHSFAKYSALVIESTRFGKRWPPARQDISEQEIAELKTSILTLREQFYDLLSRRYDKLLVA